MARLSGAADEKRTPASGQVKAVLDNDRRAESLLLESPAKIIGGGLIYG